MNRRNQLWIFIFSLCFGWGAPLFADIHQSVLDLLTELSRDYVEKREEVYFKVPLGVVPFVDSGPLAEQHEIGAVVDDLIRSEVANSTYFVLTERENLEQILEEIELSLSDMADASRTVEVGRLTGARILLAGSITEAGSNFLLNGRLIDVETGVVIGAHSVAVPKEVLITEAEVLKYEYVTRYGLGLYGLIGGDIPFSGIPRSDKFVEFPALVHSGLGVSYRPRRFLQIAASMNVTWGEFQYGAFDPSDPNYGNTAWLDTYYYSWSVPPVDTSLPTYSVEYSQKYLDVLVYYVWQPLKPLTLSVGGGGLVGLYTNRIKMKNYPIYIGPIDPVSGEPDTSLLIVPADLFLFWIRQDVVVQGGNALTYGLIAAIKIEYFLSPRIALSLHATYRHFFPTLAYQYTFGGFSTEEDQKFYQLSGWIPGITPYGDDLDIRFHTIGLFLGVAGSF